jgi:hypothetical protein
VITKALYRSLREKNFTFSSPINGDLKIDGGHYCGYFETILKTKRASAPGVKFYVVDDILQEKAVIERQFAKILQLI